MSPTWLTAFLDFPGAGYETGVAFWRAVTGFGISAPRGRYDEFATLVPRRGDPYLRVQRVGDPRSRVHLDVHRVGQAFEVRRSPGGLTYCHVGHDGARIPPAADWGTHRSAVDQVCLDIPPSCYEEECAFWQAETGWELVDTDTPEFRRLRRPDGMPLHLLLQRLDDDRDGVSAHLDLSTTDRAAEVARNVDLGARLVRVHDGWTVMEDPTGLAYCITDRSPTT